MNKLLQVILGGFIGLFDYALAIPPVEAATIEIINSGFEEPSLAGLEPIVGEEIFTFTTPPGWQLLVYWF